mmetsp:Transcript_4596/g.18372  ORF Transcript_4596/g.18372 Transcript_4596/m.18372 type:complete len:201 (+) Transcript_4596:134-736(+)
MGWGQHPRISGVGRGLRVARRRAARRVREERVLLVRARVRGGPEAQPVRPVRRVLRLHGHQGGRRRGDRSGHRGRASAHEHLPRRGFHVEDGGAARLPYAPRPAAGPARGVVLQGGWNAHRVRHPRELAASAPRSSVVVRRRPVLRGRRELGDGGLVLHDHVGVHGGRLVRGEGRGDGRARRAGVRAHGEFVQGRARSAV